MRRTQAANSSSNAFASFRSRVSNPSVNQPYTGARSSRRHPALVAPEAGHTHRRTQLPGFCLLLTSYCESTIKIRFCLFLI